MKFAIDKQDHYAVFSLVEPKLNSLVAPDLKTEMVLLNNEGFRNIIVDLRTVEFIDSSGLSAILVANRLCGNSEGHLVVTGTTLNVSRLIKISQLDSVLNIIPTLEEGKDYIMLEELARELQGKGEQPADADNEPDADDDGDSSDSNENTDTDKDA